MPGIQRVSGYPTASLAMQASAASNFKAQQDLLTLIAVRQVIAIWMQLDQAAVRSSWPVLRVALAALIRDRFGMSARSAETYYAQARTAAGITGPFDAAVVREPDQAVITATLDSMGPYNLLAKIKAAQPVAQAMENTAVQLSGAASRLIVSGARQAILTAVQQDQKAVGWMRVTSASPCSFCAMLASRGVTYRSEKSAAFSAHDHCMCTAQPVFSAQDAKALADNDLYRQWKQATAGHSGKDALNAWRRYWSSAHPDALGAKVA